MVRKLGHGDHEENIRGEAREITVQRENYRNGWNRKYAREQSCVLCLKEELAVHRVANYLQL